MTRELVLDGSGNVVELQQTPNLDIVTTSPREPAAWERTCLGVQSATLDAPDQRAYDARAGLRSKRYLTMLAPHDAQWIVDRVRDRIAGKVVVELGAGIGVLAVALASHAKRVFAIEADPMWSWVFSRWLYRSKPNNLTFIMDMAEHLTDVIKADVAIVVTGSDEERLRATAERFAPEVIMPWQDWNGGKARVPCWHPFLSGDPR